MLREVEVLARVHTKAAVSTLVSVMNNHEAPAAARVTAANSILDRGWGKPQQNVRVDAGPEFMSDDDLARNIETRLAIIAASHARAGQAGSEAGGDDSGDEEEAGPLVSSGVVH